MKTRLHTAAATVAAATALLITATPAAQARPSCALDGNELQVELAKNGDSASATYGNAGEITIAGAARGRDPETLDCGGNTTSSNVSAVVVNDVTNEGSTRFALINPYPFETRPISVDVGLGAGADDLFTIIGTEASDQILLGVDAVAFDLDNDSLASSYITHSGADRYSMRGLGGDDFLLADADNPDTPTTTKPIRFLTGSAPTGDVVFGGDGPDTILGSSRADMLYGSRGNDTIRGGAGKDSVGGFLGRDSLFGGPGADGIGAQDQTRDKVISCGAGRDEFTRDRTLDPKPRSCEKRLELSPAP